MKSLIVSAVVLASQILFSAAITDRTWIKGLTDKNPLEYKLGEKMNFTLEMKELAGTPREGEYTLKWTRTGDDGLSEEGTVPFTGKNFEYTTSIAKPGFVRIQATILDTKGKKAAKLAYFDGSAGAGLDALPINPEPEDFDAFWQRQYDRLDKVPIKAELIETKGSNEAVRIYAVSVTCAGLRPVTGYMAVPRAIDEGKKFPAKLGLHGYSGDSFKHGVPDPTVDMSGSCISFSINAHGLKLPEFGATEADRKAFYWEARSNGHTYAFDPAQNEDPETAYFNGMLLRVKRALQYLKTLDGWNKRELIAEGGSQGGMQAIWAGACREGVTIVRSNVPWNCDIKTNSLRSDKTNNLSSWGWYIKWTKGLAYYDVINFAKRLPVSCRLEVPRAGLGDYICPPMGIMKMWNVVRCPKKITWVQGSEHGNNVPCFDGVEFPYEKDSEIRALTPMVPDGVWPQSWWMKRHHEKMKLIEKDPPEVVFLGDSITHLWDATGSKPWKSLFEGKPYSAISLGFSGDRTEQLIWRIVDGKELDGYEAKAIVIMIGTNNTGHMPANAESPEDTFRGVSRVVALVRAKQPKATIILHPIFPRGEKITDSMRIRNDKVNRSMKALADGETVIWCDINDSFVDADGNLPSAIFPDLLHPAEEGYVRWAAKIKPYIEWAVSDRTTKAPKQLYSKYMEKADAMAK